MAATRIVSQDIKDLTIVDGDVAAANKDGTTSTPSMRTLGTGSTQAAAGNHTHASSHVYSEVPGGAVDGANADFTLLATPTAGTLRLFKNGMRQKAAAGNDYTLTTNTITFLAGNIPQTGDVLLADYE
jgi:hypothetical protein